MSNPAVSCTYESRSLGRAFILALGLLGCSLLADDLPDVTASAADPAPSKGAELVLPLKKAVDANLEYCRQWLAAKDFKTLAQTAGGVALLADALGRKSDAEGWQQAAGRLIADARALEAAAKQQDGPRCGTLIADLERQSKELKTPPEGKPRTAGPPAAGVKLMMALLEGTLADAKMNVSVGEPQAAKANAIVLSELGTLVSNYRSDARWSQWSQELSAAALDVSRLETNDPQMLRAAFKGIRQRCDQCHDRR